MLLASAEFRLVVVEVSSRRASVAGNIRCLKHFCPRTRIVLLVDADELREIRAVCGAEVSVLSKPIDVDEIGRIARTAPHGAPVVEFGGLPQPPASSRVPAGR